MYTPPSNDLSMYYGMSCTMECLRWMLHCAGVKASKKIVFSQASYLELYSEMIIISLCNPRYDAWL